MNDGRTPPPNSDITPEEWQQTPERVRAWIKGVWEEIKQLKATVEKLQEAGNRNSGNSSQPPSQDRPEQKPTKEKPSQPRKRGGQAGHHRHRRNLVEHVNEVIHHRPVSCRGCGALMLGEDPTPYRHQVTELPIVKPYVVEHQVHRIDCPCCRLTNRGELPPEVAASQFGLNVISLARLCI
jgi:transposase